MGLTLQHPPSGGLGVAPGVHHRQGATSQVGGQAEHARRPPTASVALPGPLQLTETSFLTTRQQGDFPF